MVFAGSALMVVNIWRYIQFTRKLQEKNKWGEERRILYIPIFLLVMFLFGYLAVGIIGKPDLIVSGILFGGSIFVFIIFMVLQRITSHVQENERLEADLKAAEESSKMKSAFLSSMSHEMRTPLNAIIGFNHLALQNPDLPPEAREQLEKTESSAKRLLEMINNILDINSIDAGGLQLKENEFSLRDMLDQVSFTTQTRCNRKGLAFESRKGDLDDYYLGDEAALEHALLNILGNAVKYTTAPGKVTLTAEQDVSSGSERTLRFIVQDTGVGIDDDLMPHLFSFFTSGDDGSADNAGGIGLGLALSKRVAKLMHGDITVESKKGQGSTFTLTVRLRASGRKGEAAPQRDEPEVPTDLAGLKVLIVDDIDLNAEIAAELLNLEGVVSDRAENGRIAVEMFSNSPPNTYDAILMDLRMPVMDGLDASRAIRALDRPDAKTVPILALTANAFEEDVRNSLQAGMNAHIPKPVDADSLFENLRRLISKRKAQESAGQGKGS